MGEGMVIRIRKMIAMLWALLVLHCVNIITVSAFDGARIEENERLAIERMTRGFEGLEESIDLSDLNISTSSLSVLFSHATKNTPYLFYVDKRLTYTYRGDTVIKVMPKYNMTKEEANTAIGFCKAEVGKMAELILVGESELERMILAHDLICSRYKYDLSLESNNIYKFIKEGKGTCQGYTWTYMALLREVGIECEYVASDSIDHIWLRVKLDGDWYNSDVTWDDPVGNEGNGTQICRNHLLFSDVEADRDGYRDRYGASGNKCTSEKYDGVDLSDLVSPDHTAGDVNHDGAVGLADLVALRLCKRVCPICADIDVDMAFSEGDINALRHFILTKSYE